jgi:hypothetical protein
LQPAAVIATYVHGFVRLMIAVALPMPYQWPWQVVDSSSNGRAPDMAAKDLLVLVAVTFAMVSDTNDRSGSGSSAKQHSRPEQHAGLVNKLVLRAT